MKQKGIFYTIIPYRSFNKSIYQRCFRSLKSLIIYIIRIKIKDKTNAQISKKKGRLTNGMMLKVYLFMLKSDSSTPIRRIFNAHFYPLETET